tara:strand:+ start:1550 stop:2401 length:852 start_codon:yes stop_codon:yes gene_type:complete
MPTYPSPYSYLKSQSGGSSTPDSLLLIKGGLLAAADVQELDPVNNPPVTTGARLSFSADGVSPTRLQGDASQSLPFGDLATQSITVATWVKFNNLLGGFQRDRVFSIRTGGQNNWIELYVENANTIRASCKRTSTVSSADSSPVSTGVWYHIAVVWDHSATTLTIYLNGASATTATGSNSNNGNPSVAGICLAARSQNNCHQSGFFQDFGIWNKALAANEVAAIASAAFDLGTNSGNYQSSANLKLWWSMQKRTGNAAAVVDSSGNFNIGSMLGTYTLSTDVP